ATRRGLRTSAARGWRRASARSTRTEPRRVRRRSVRYASSTSTSSLLCPPSAWGRKHRRRRTPRDYRREGCPHRVLLPRSRYLRLRLHHPGGRARSSRPAGISAADRQAPSIDFAGTGGNVRWVSWYEPNTALGLRGRADVQGHVLHHPLAVLECSH